MIADSLAVAFISHRLLVFAAKHQHVLAAALFDQNLLAFGRRLFEHHHDDVVSNCGSRLV